jgi:hypothetical protein
LKRADECLSRAGRRAVVERLAEGNPEPEGDQHADCEREQLEPAQPAPPGPTDTALLEPVHGV